MLKLKWVKGDFPEILLRPRENNHRWGKKLTTEEINVLKLSQPGRIEVKITDLETKSETFHTAI